MDGFFTALTQHAFLQTAVVTALLASIGCGVMGTYVVVKGAAKLPLTADILHDTTGHLHDRLCVEGPTLCIIRPDGHLGFRSTPPTLESLNAHLDRMYGTG